MITAEGTFKVEVDPEDFEMYKFGRGFKDDKTAMENYIAVVLLRLYAGSAPESADIMVRNIR